MTWAEFITAMKDIVLAFAAAFTAGAAISGISKWRKELTGKTQFDAAFKLAKATYRVRDAVRACRSRLIGPAEFPPNVTNTDSANAYAFVFQNRWNAVFSALQEFDTHALTAEALWGENSRLKTDALRKCVLSLNAAMGAFIDDKAHNGEDFREDPTFGIEMRRTVFGSLETLTINCARKLKLQSRRLRST